MAVLRRRSTKKIHDSNNNFDLNEFLKQKGFQSYPINLKSLVKEVGIRLKMVEMDPEVSGYLRKVDENWVMGVNALHHPNRKRFTIAHELAHYFLHSKVLDSFEDTVLFRKGESNKYETQANRFAAELLMPKNEFLNFVKNESTNVEKIAEHFEVSAMAVRIRAKDLGLGGHGV